MLKIRSKISNSFDLIDENFLGELDVVILFVRGTVKLSWNTRDVQDICISLVGGAR